MHIIFVSTSYFFLTLGMALGPSDIAVSLGTSDTVFVSMDKLKEDGFTEGHIFVNPIATKTHYMALLCFRNGSLTRERIKRNYSDNSWKIYNELLNTTPRGNFGNIGMYFDLWEILPKIKSNIGKYKRQIQYFDFGICLNSLCSS